MARDARLEDAHPRHLQADHRALVAVLRAQALGAADPEVLVGSLGSFQLFTNQKFFILWVYYLSIT